MAPGPKIFRHPCRRLAAGTFSLYRLLLRQAKMHLSRFLPSHISEATMSVAERQQIVFHDDGFSSTPARARATSPIPRP
jgi:hypothetical protein